MNQQAGVVMGVTRTLDSYIISKKCAELIVDEYENLDKVK